MLTRDDLIDNYKKFLANKHPGRIKSFCDLLASHPASARAEAITFYFLRDQVDSVQIEEDPTKGGVDFRCETRKSEFVVEVTHLKNESVSQASGKRNEIPEKNTVGSYCRITHLLRRNASDKARQMSGYCCPSLLVMTSEHVYANDLLSSKIAAEFLLTSDTSIPVLHPSANPETDLVLETDLNDSVFFDLMTRTMILNHADGAFQRSCCVVFMRMQWKLLAFCIRILFINFLSSFFQQFLLLN